MQDFNWNKEYRAVVGSTGVFMMTHPETGLAWESTKQAKSWFEAEKKRQQQELGSGYIAENVTKEQKVLKPDNKEVEATIQPQKKPNINQKRRTRNKTGKSVVNNQPQKQVKAG